MSKVDFVLSDADVKKRADLLALAFKGEESAAKDYAAAVKSANLGAILKHGEDVLLQEAAAMKKDPIARAGAMCVFKFLVTDVGQKIEPFLISMLPMAMTLYADKVSDVVNAAKDAVQALTHVLTHNAIKAILPIIFQCFDITNKPRTKNGALEMLDMLIEESPKHVANCLIDIVPALCDPMAELDKGVSEVAVACMGKACLTMGNKDIIPFIPALVSCIQNPDEVPDTVHKLSATTFVAQVDSPCLSVMVPVLSRGLATRSQTAIKRKASVIIDNMCKLVDDPRDALPFVPKLLPLLLDARDKVSDPECRNMADRATKTLLRVANLKEESGAEDVSKATTPEEVLKTLVTVLDESGIKADSSPAFSVISEFVSCIGAMLIVLRNFEESEWMTMLPYLTTLASNDAAEKVVKLFLERCYRESEELVKEKDDDEEGEDLCDCEFSLAYGGKILLNNTKFHLKRGQLYGLCGHNGCGKSTLMRAIANDQVEGFPPPSELRCAYVEHDIQGADVDLSVVDFVYESIKDNEYILSKGVSKEDIIKQINSVGFTDNPNDIAYMGKPITALSGGWKMKLALARAMLLNTDILLLDEPTNHLDVNNVAWLINYLTNLPQCTSIIVSHDSKFLDAVCTGIIHYEHLKLKKYRGNLSEFVKQVPEAKSYYELSNDNLQFKFPEPGFLEGVKNKDKAILKLRDVSFMYPGTDKWIFKDVDVQCSLSSRIACTGRNGAGKSTLIKVLCGENEPTSGEVWKHPNMRIAYVAQHAFHHIDEHLDKTPNEYIQWRYRGGEDKEAADKVQRQISAEEQEQMMQKVMVNGEKKILEKLCGRRKGKGTYEYEVQWEGLYDTTWLPRKMLEDMGFAKLVYEIDEKEAAGLFVKPLTQKSIEKHLNDVGLEPEFASHSHIKGLSGGQKVKLVMGAALWNNPHLLVLDEPTNYLDRDSLGALAMAVKDFGGGVLIISHNRDFTEAICPEKWHMEEGPNNHGVLEVTGNLYKMREKVEFKVEEEVTDAFGNVTKVKAPKKKLSRKEMKQREKIRKAKIERGEEVSSDEGEF